MPSVWRFLRPALLSTIAIALALPFSPAPLYAQDDDTGQVVIQGSLQLEPLLTAIRDAYVAQNEDAAILIDAQGPSLGFEALCAGEADLVMSTDPISDQQAAACATQGADFIETVLAYEAIVLLADPAAGLECVDRSLVEEVFSLGAAPEVTWEDLGSTTASGPVTFYGPGSNGASAQAFASLLPAGELREDLESGQAPADLLVTIGAEGSNGFGFMSLAEWEAAASEDSTAPLAVRDAVGECVAPSVETLEARTYPLTRTVYLYVNAASAGREDVRAFVDFALSDEAGAAAVAAEQGFTVPTDAIYAEGAANVADLRGGRTFSRAVTPVDVPTTQEGTVTIVGSPMLHDLTAPIVREFTAQFPNATVSQRAFGTAAGWDALCANEADVLQATGPAGDEAFEACKANGVETVAIDLGLEALVLAVPAGNDWAQCMTADQVAVLLSAGLPDDAAPAPEGTAEAEPAAVATEEAAPVATEAPDAGTAEPGVNATPQPAPEGQPVTNWNELDPEWPDLPLLLVAPPLSTGETDYLIQTLTGDLSFVPRTDMVESSDPLYRAQGVANTAQDETNPNNGLTYLWWSALQSSEADVRLVEIDAGEGCVAPSPETFEDGTYPLSFPVSYYFNRGAFENPLVRALLWHFFDVSTLETLREHPYALSDYDRMATIQRDEIFNLLSEYEASPAEPSAEATPSATDAAAPDATEAPAAEVTEAAPAATEAPATDATEVSAPDATEAAGE